MPPPPHMQVHAHTHAHVCTHTYSLSLSHIPKLVGWLISGMWLNWTILAESNFSFSFVWERNQNPEEFRRKNRLTKHGVGASESYYKPSVLWESVQVSLCSDVFEIHASLVAQSVKNLPAVQEIPVRSLVWEDPLEKEMATHSSLLAWKISWTEEPGGLQSMGLWRVGHDWATSTYLTVSGVRNFDWLVNLLPSQKLISNTGTVWITFCFEIISNLTGKLQ